MNLIEENKLRPNEDTKNEILKVFDLICLDFQDLRSQRFLTKILRDNKILE